MVIVLSVFFLLSRKNDKPDILIEVRSGIARKPNPTAKPELNAPIEQFIVEGKLIGTDSTNKNAFGDKRKFQDDINEECGCISDAQTSTQSDDDHTSDSGSQDKSMQAINVSNENKSITAVSDTSEEAAQVALGAAAEDKLTSTSLAPDFTDACTSDKIVLGLYTETDNNEICECAAANDSSYDTLLTITMNMAEDESVLVRNEEFNDSSDEICNCINCEYANQEKFIRDGEDKKEKVYFSVKTSARSMGGAENNGESKGMQTLKDTPSRIQKRLTDYDSEYYINQHTQLYNSRVKADEVDQNNSSDAKKKVSYVESRVNNQINSNAIIN